jgi:hypothetical protein
MWLLSPERADHNGDVGAGAQGTVPTGSAGSCAVSDGE